MFKELHPKQPFRDRPSFYLRDILNLASKVNDKTLSGFVFLDALFISIWTTVAAQISLTLEQFGTLANDPLQFPVPSSKNKSQISNHPYPYRSQIFHWKTDQKSVAFIYILLRKIGLRNLGKYGQTNKVWVYNTFTPSSPVLSCFTSPVATQENSEQGSISAISD